MLQGLMTVKELARQNGETESALYQKLWRSWSAPEAIAQLVGRRSYLYSAAEIRNWLDARPDDVRRKAGRRRQKREWNKWLSCLKRFRAIGAGRLSRAEYQKLHLRLNARRYAENGKKNRDRRKQSDPAFKIAKRLRFAIYRMARYHGLRKSRRTIDYLGCSFTEAAQYIENQFLPGMSWENHGFHGWHIDHKRPLSSFDLTDPQQQLAATHFTNLQPLWAKDNMLKRDSWCG